MRGLDDPLTLVTILLSVGILPLLLPAIRNREKPGATGFVILIWSASVYLLGTALNLIAATPIQWVVSHNIVLLGATCLAVGWLVFAIEYTDLVSVSTRTLLILSSPYPIVVQLLGWTGWWYVPLDAVDPETIGGNLTDLFWVHVAIGYMILVVGTVIIAYNAVRTGGIQRRQSTALLVAAIPPIATNAPFTFDLIAFNPTAIGFAISIFILGWALFYADFLDIVPVARRRVYEEMADPALTVDEQGRVVDANGAARSIAGVTTGWQGKPVEQFFDRFPTEFHDAIDADSTNPAVSVRVDGEQYHFQVRSLPIEAGEDDQRGQFVILRDITVQTERARKLDLMRQVQSRVLRHNIRNDLTTIAGYADRLELDPEADVPARAAEIREQIKEMTAMTEKAREIEQLVEDEQSPRTIDLREILTAIVGEYRGEFPAVEFRVDAPEELLVDTVPAIELVIGNLVENGAEHNDSAEPSVHVLARTEEEEAVIDIADNGPGIPESELAVLHAGEETQLEHGSGIGLWLIQWVVESSAISVTYETDADGTTATVRVPLATSG